MKKVKFYDECVFCGKKKIWKSAIAISSDDSVVAVTVCPECRKEKTIADLYYAVLIKILEEEIE